MENEIILVDENDNEIGVGEKLEVHKSGKLHRAFSIFIFNLSGQLLIQKRASNKYHSGGLWSNTCCSHPRPGEGLEMAVHARLREEMGFDCELKEIYKFIYKVRFDNGLTEHECDHVFIGKSDAVPVLNAEEAEDWKWADPRWLSADMKDNPIGYTYWFKMSLDDVLANIKAE